jgi:hypothetical protein
MRGVLTVKHPRESGWDDEEASRLQANQQVDRGAMAAASAAPLLPARPQPATQGAHAPGKCCSDGQVVHMRDRAYEGGQLVAPFAQSPCTVYCTP